MSYLKDYFASFIKLIKYKKIYDTETTGLDKTSLQPTQVASINCDDNLNIISTHNESSIIREDVTPSPYALLTTKCIDSLQLQGPSSYQMIQEKNQEWTQTIEQGPTCFIGFNSDSFDEAVIQRARFINCLSPYITNTGGSTRMDVLKLIHLLVSFYPEFPRKVNEKGNISCRLVDVADSLGVAYENAHDALADCSALLDVLKIIRRDFPEVYDSGLINSSKEGSVSFLENVEPFLVMGEVYRTPFTRPVVLISYTEKGNGIALFDLSFEPEEVLSLSYPELEDLVHNPRSGPIKTVQKNKTLPLLPESAVSNLENHFNVSYLELCRRAKLVQKDQGFKEKVKQALLTKKYKTFPCTTAEESIYSGPWISDEDLLYAERFHLAPLEEKWAMRENFVDWRWKEFANRILCQQDLKSAPRDLRNWYDKFVISRRHCKWSKDRHFLTNDMALKETLKLKQETTSKRDLEILNEVEKFLTKRSI
tara:strand:+ start:2590 stop:4029 length:1440 start_codon:yes stop_codon:yes gene_type:complete